MPLRCGSFRDCWATNCPYPPHFKKETWYRTSDLNRDCSVPKTDASCQLDYGALLVGAPGFEPGRSDGALCSTGRRGQPYPPDTRTLLITWRRAWESNPVARERLAR